MVYVGSMISRPPVTVPRTTTIGQAAREMARTGVGALLVVDNDRLVGIVTDRDVVIRGVARGVGADGRIDALMTTDVITIPAGMGVERAYEIFHDHALRRLPVLDGRRVVGIVTVDDLLIRSERQMADLVHAVHDETFAPHREPASPVVTSRPPGRTGPGLAVGGHAARRTAMVAGPNGGSGETASMVRVSGSPVFPRRTGMLRARPGDTLIIHSHVPRTADRSGQVCAARSDSGDPPFAVRWSDTGAVSFVFPGPDAEVRHRPEPAARRPRVAAGADG
ncbi:CBS domain-containing protein [Frankia sp. AgPm24]|uniref:CBS domain-containing protein n=1 Tax=Frankia sp. AgPm24 TaxID=631128 RepID=UPI00200BCE39|nr:CBS domain-containing protein [Frankia sp. AgPm24]MCK9923484.1 CBS domain-containing protein [Frankia sp. AgPm24]